MRNKELREVSRIEVPAVVSAMWAKEGETFAEWG